MGVNMIVGSCIGSHVIGSNVNQIPSQALATLWLDGSIVDVAGSKYFVDKIAGNNVLITGYDFPAGWVKGFPYKSAATIDIFGQTGVPIVSLFQNFDYGNQYFTKHVAQVVDGNGVETSEAYVAEMVAYSAPLTGDDLTEANTYYGVPAKNVNGVWLADNGNDDTGNGTEALPYKTLAKIATTAAPVAYLKSGAYAVTTALDFTGAALTLKGIGATSIVARAATFGFEVHKVIVFDGINILAQNATSYGIGLYANSQFIRCKAVKTNGSALLSTRAAGLTIALTDCLLTASNTYGLYYSTSLPASVAISNCILTTNNLAAIASLSLLRNSIKNALSLASMTSLTIIDNTIAGGLVTIATANEKIKYNRITAANGAIALQVTAAQNANITGVEIENNTISGNLATGYLVYIGTTGVELGVNSINAAKIRANKITNNSVAGTGACHTLFVGGGINNLIKYNELTANNGYGIVIKSGGIHYSTTESHVSYNKIKHTGTCVYSILIKAAHSINIANNTIVNFIGTAVFGSTIESTLDTAMTVFNNLVDISGNCAVYGGTNPETITGRNNVVNKNGFTCSIAANDFETAVVISDDAIPASKIEHAETVENEGVGLATTCVIPTSMVYENQAATWQNGAVILP